ALYNRYMVNKDSIYLMDMLPDLEADYAAWEQDRRLPNGLFWQTDVKDGMEESLSGGRRERNMRPTINSYMYGNALAISKMQKMAGNVEKARLFQLKADTMKQLIQKELWNAADTFFETKKQTGELAKVREAIGYIPWYFNLP